MKKQNIVIYVLAFFLILTSYYLFKTSSELNRLSTENDTMVENLDSLDEKQAEIESLKNEIILLKDDNALMQNENKLFKDEDERLNDLIERLVITDITGAWKTYSGEYSSENRIINDLISRTDLIPYEGVLGGTMGFVEIYVLNNQWVYTVFEDGHIMGSSLLKYTENEDSIEWEIVESFMY